MNNDIRIALRKAAEALCRFDAGSMERAEAAIMDAVAFARKAIADGSFRAAEWPPPELAQCRQMTENWNLVWERRRARAVVTSNAAPSSWMA